MSVSLLLVPMAVASAAAVHGATAGQDSQGRIVCTVQTRMRDAHLLAAALRDTQATVVTGDDEIIADWAGVRAVFRRGSDGIWSAHLSGDVDTERAVDIVKAVDAAYGRQVQRAVVERLRERSATVGLRLESEQVTEDASVQMVFTVEGR